MVAQLWPCLEEAPLTHQGFDEAPGAICSDTIAVTGASKKESEANTQQYSLCFKLFCLN